MRIAFDVKGTIEGSKKKQVLRMFELFQKAGHKVFVWSNSYGYAVDAVRDNNLANTSPMDKMMKMDAEEEQMMDIAVEDDHSQTWLAAKKFVFVDEIPDDMVLVDIFVEELLKGNK